MKFSIIVPVYNVENYINICIDSLLNQDYNNYEILLIDDCSTDNSGNICDKYSQKHSFIKTFHKKNSGLSDARNLGIEKAEGDYIIFVDSDDYIKENILKEFANTLKNNDVEILITRLAYKFENNIVETDKNISMYINLKKGKYNAKKWIIKKSADTWPAQKYIVSKKFIDKNHLRFKSGFFHEDIEWTSLLCIYGEKFNYFEHIWYYYRRNRENSITNVLNEKKILDVIQITNDIIYGKYSGNLNEMDSRERKLLKNRLNKSVYFWLSKCRYLDKDKINIVSKKLIKMKKILNSPSGFKHKIFSITIKIFGFKNMIHFLSICKFIK